MPTQTVVAPRPELAPWIHHILVMHFAAPCLSTLPAVLSPKILFIARGAAWSPEEPNSGGPQARAEIGGPRLSPAPVVVEAGTCFISILFRPGVMAEALGPGVDELRDRVFPLDSVLPPQQVAEVLERIDAEANPGRWVEHIQNLLLQSLRAQRDRRILAAQFGNRANLFAPAAQQAAALGIGLRQLERRVGHAYGATLRDLRRMVRFGFALARLLAGPSGRGDLVRIAHDLGYYDQAHMDRDFAALSAYSPSQLLHALAADDPAVWIYRFTQQDFGKLFLPDDVDSIQEALSSRS